MLNQLGNILRTPAQRGNLEFYDLEPVVEVEAELSLTDGLLQVLVGCGNDPDVHGNGIMAADPGNFPLFQDPEEAHLCHERHFADLVQEDRATVRLLENSQVLGLGIGESSLLMTKKFVFQQVFRNGGAIDGFERPLSPLTVLVQGIGDRIFSNAAFSNEKYGDRGRLRSEGCSREVSE